MDQITPIKKVNVGEQVFEQLKTLLVQGRWRQGEKLPSENELAEQFGVSRITVRQALQKLSALGLIETRLGEGSFVREVQPGDSMNALIPAVYLSGDTMEQVLEFRDIIEVSSVSLAVRRAQPEDTKQLRSILEEMENSVGDALRFSELDLEFHLQLGRMTGNDLVVKTQAILYPTLREAMNEIVQLTGYEPGIYYHTRLVKSVELRDEASAVKLMREHLENNKTAYASKEEKTNGL